MDRLLKPYFKYYRAFINDIVIFFNITENYLAYFKKIFAVFIKKNISIFLKKLFLSYPFIKLFSFRINALEIFIIK
jgi:hypothetical protein